MSFWDKLPIIGDIVGSVGSAASGIMSDAAMRYAADQNLAGVRETNQMNLQIANSNNEAAKQLWREQSEYNTPKNQMQRYLDAGLNPNLMASSGQVGSGNAATPPTLQQAHMSAYTGHVRDALARVQNIRDSITGINKALTDIASLHKIQQDTATSKAQEEFYNAQSANLNRLSPERWKNLWLSNNWMNYRQNAFNEYTGLGINPFISQWDLGKYNSEIAKERSIALQNDNLAWSLYGLEHAKWRLEHTKSATERNRIASKVQAYLAPALYRNYISAANLRDEQTQGVIIGNGLAGMNFLDNQNGGNFGFSIGGAKFTLGSLMRGIRGLGQNIKDVFSFKPLSNYYY